MTSPASSELPERTTGHRSAALPFALLVALLGTVVALASLASVSAFVPTLDALRADFAFPYRFAGAMSFAMVVTFATASLAVHRRGFGTILFALEENRILLGACLALSLLLTASVLQHRASIWTGAALAFVACALAVAFAEWQRAFPLRLSLSERQLQLALFAGPAALFSLYGILRHVRFHSRACDFGSYVQTFWLYSRWKAPINTVLEGDHALGDHFGPILAVLAQLMHLVPGPSVLVLVQAGIVASAAIPIFRFARSRGQTPGASAALALCFLFAIGVQSAIDYDFHLLALGSALLCWVFWLGHCGSTRQLFFAVALYLATKEHIVSYLAAFGAYLFLFEKRRREGAVIFVVATLWFALVPTVVMPLFHRADGRPAVPHFSFSFLGHDMREALVFVLTHPLKAAAGLFDHPKKQATVILTFGGPLFLALLRPQWLLMAIPMLGERFWSWERTRWDVGFHYSGPLTALAVFAAIDALPHLEPKLRWLLEKLKSTVSPAALVAGAPSAMLLSTLLIALTGHDPAGALFDPSSAGWKSEPRAGIFERAVGVVDPDPSVAVAAQDELLPHLAMRDRIYMLDTGLDAAPEFVVLDLVGSTWPLDAQGYKAVACRALKDASRHPVFSEEQVVVLSTRGSAVPLTAEAEAFARACP